MDTCGARTTVMRACACLAMAICTAGRITWSAVPTTAQDGMVFQAGTPDFWLSAMVDSGSSRGGEHPGFTQRQAVGEAGGEQVLLVVRVEHAAGAPGYVARLKMVVGSAATTQDPGTEETSCPMVWPWSGAKAST